jgi:hypothetical protein
MGETSANLAKGRLSLLCAQTLLQIEVAPSILPL